MIQDLKKNTFRKPDGTPFHTKSKINEMKHTHRYKRVLDSDLLKFDQQTKNIGYTNHHRRLVQ